MINETIATCAIPDSNLNPDPINKAEEQTIAGPSILHNTTDTQESDNGDEIECQVQKVKRKV